MEGARILFVDDEPSLVLTMPQILRQSGYEVTAVSTVNEALSQVVSAPFDVLISDLNIGEPGDGLVVVSAMRRTQPNCVTLILTGYPGFETALEAIRKQVDDYLVKPAPIPTLLKVIEDKLANPKAGKVEANKRISHIIRENLYEITERALREMKADPLLGALPITDEERIEHTPRALEELATILESDEPEIMARNFDSTMVRGVKRYQLGYTIPLLATHVRLSQRAIYDVIHENLLSLNLSNMMFDLKQLNDILVLQLEHTLMVYLEAQQDQAKEQG
jgi:ActR/RegA family two-component response regulator